MFSNPKTGRPHAKNIQAHDKKIKNLEKSFYVYLSFDQKADNRFHDPFDKNKKYWDAVKKDARKLAEIAYKHFYETK
jgi:hypothetical protein